MAESFLSALLGIWHRLICWNCVIFWYSIFFTSEEAFPEGTSIYWGMLKVQRNRALANRSNFPKISCRILISAYIIFLLFLSLSSILLGTLQSQVRNESLPSLIIPEYFSSIPKRLDLWVCAITPTGVLRCTKIKYQDER